MLQMNASFSVVVDYENDTKASTGHFELIYEGAPIETIDKLSSTNETHTKDVSQTLVTVVSTELRKTNPTVMIKDIGLGMRQTLENLLMILKREKEKRRNFAKHSLATIGSMSVAKKNQSIETIKSIACMNTQTLSKIKIVETNSDETVTSYHWRTGKMSKDGETNTMKYTKDYILNMLKQKIDIM